MLIDEPNYYAKLISVTKANGENYPENNWRIRYVGREGNINFKYYSGYIEFYQYNMDKFGNDYVDWVLKTSLVSDIKEADGKLVVKTISSIYEFEITHKTPNVDTSECFKEFLKKAEQHKEMIKQMRADADKWSGNMI